MEKKNQITKSMLKKDVLIAEKYLDWVSKCQSGNHDKNMLGKAEGYYERLSADDFDKDEHLLNCKNVTVDLRSGDSKKHDKADLITKCTNIIYDKNATAPRWEKFLQETILDKNGKTDFETIAILQNCVGYSATGSCREEIFFMMHGRGQNGKTKFLEAINHALGDYATVAPDGLFVYKREKNTEHMAAGLVGARFASSSEITEGQSLDEKYVKQLTGGDTMSACFKFKERFNFKPSHKLWFAVNHMPSIRSGGDATTRRIRVIPFQAKITAEKIDKKLMSKLKNESAGILKWIIDGAGRWYRTGETESENMLNAKNEYLADVDVFGNWCDTFLDLSTDRDTLSADLFCSFNIYLEKQNERKITQTMFGRKLIAKFNLQKYRKNGAMYYSGVRLKNIEFECVDYNADTEHRTDPTLFNN